MVIHLYMLKFIYLEMDPRVKPEDDGGEGKVQKKMMQKKITPALGKADVIKWSKLSIMVLQCFGLL